MTLQGGAPPIEGGLCGPLVVMGGLVASQVPVKKVMPQITYEIREPNFQNLKTNAVKIKIM